METGMSTTLAFSRIQEREGAIECQPTPLYWKIGAFDRIALKKSICFANRATYSELQGQSTSSFITLSVVRAMRKWIHLIESCADIIIHSASSQLPIPVQAGFVASRAEMNLSIAAAAACQMLFAQVTIGEG
jgi:hypothetical protein